MQRRRPRKSTGKTRLNADTTGYGPRAKPESAATKAKLHLQFMIRPPRVFRGNANITSVCSRPANGRVQRDGGASRRASDHTKPQADIDEHASDDAGTSHTKQRPRATNVCKPPLYMQHMPKTTRRIGKKHRSCGDHGHCGEPTTSNVSMRMSRTKTAHTV